jgi:hypothetical protein
MKTMIRILSLTALVAGAGTAMGQESTPPVPKPTAQSEAGEPRASTSQPTADAPAPAAKPAPTSRSGKTAAQAAAVPSAKAKGPGGNDRLDLGTATVTGDREQPKVMYIVPWKRSDIGDLAGKPMNSLVDEILSPVDRDVFKREVVYYKAVQADASQNGAAGRRPSDQGEK